MPQPSLFARVPVFIVVVFAAIAATLAASAASAPAAVLYQENFDDDVLAPNTTIDDAQVSGGVLSIQDNLTTDKGVLNVVQSFISPVMTFSFDVTEPVVYSGTDPGNVQTELMFRAGVGTGTDSIGSSDDLIELVLNRDGGNRGGFLNNGNESVFIVANFNFVDPGNPADTTIDFASPVDGSNVSLNNEEYVAFIRNNDDGTFVLARGPQAWLVPTGTIPDGPIDRFFIGSGSNADQNTTAIDNVGVVDMVSFATVVPEPAGVALLLGAGSLLALCRRRRNG